MITEIYQNIVERLKAFDTKLATEGYSKIKHYDLFNNQYQDEQLMQEIPFDFPAVFIEIAVDFTDMGKHTQNGTLSLRLHLVQEKYSSSFEGSVDKENALAMAKYTDLVNECLHMYYQAPFNRLKRRRLLPSVSFTNIYPIIIEYVAEIVDYSTSTDKLLEETDGNTQKLHIDEKGLAFKPNKPTAIASQYTIE